MFRLAARPARGSIRLVRWQRSLRSSAACFDVKPFLLADIGEGIAEVEVLRWFVKPGDRVGEFDPICEVQSDKATVEITSRFAGLVAHVHHDQGAIVPVGEALIDIDVEGAGASSATPADVEVPTPETARSASSAVPSDAAADFNPKEDEVATRVLTTPAVRRIARERGLDLRRIQGSGPGGRILKGDVLQALPEVPESSLDGPGFGPPGGPPRRTFGEHLVEVPPEAAEESAAPSDRTRQPLRGLQRLMARSMTASLSIPHFGFQDEVRMDELVLVRQRLQEAMAPDAGKLSYLPFLLKACSLALREFPVLNATYHEEDANVSYHGDHNLGVAMDTPRGLVVPCIKAVQSKSLEEISRELQRLQRAATAGQLTEADLAGTTFTLSNIGSVGGIYAQAVIVPPQVAIGALGRMQRVPRFLDEGSRDVVEARILNVSWSGDHRVVDGATMARFSNAFKAFVENPASMLLQMR